MSSAILYMALLAAIILPDVFVYVRNYVFSKLAAGFNYVRNLFKGD